MIQFWVILYWYWIDSPRLFQYSEFIIRNWKKRNGKRANWKTNWRRNRKKWFNNNSRKNRKLGRTFLSWVINSVTSRWDWTDILIRGKSFQIRLFENLSPGNGSLHIQYPNPDLKLARWWSGSTYSWALDRFRFVSNQAELDYGQLFSKKSSKPFHKKCRLFQKNELLFWKTYIWTFFVKM